MSRAEAARGIREALEDLAGCMDAAASPLEPKYAVAGRVSAKVVAERIREVLAAHPEPTIVLDEATVERAARAMNSQFTLQWEKLPDWIKEDELRTARAVLAAAVEVQP